MPSIVLPLAAADFCHTVLLAFSALFAIVNPLVNAIIFGQITADRTHAERMQLARRVGLYCLALLLFSLWASSYVLNFFGISLGALQVGGGLIIAVGAWRILHAPEQREAETQTQVWQDRRTAAAVNINDIAFFPVSIPFTIGPGTISVCITLSANRPASGNALPYLLALSVAAILMAVTIWLIFRFGNRTAPLIGRTGTRAIARLFALLLLCIGVQIVGAGVEALLLPIIAVAKG